MLNHENYDLATYIETDVALADLPLDIILEAIKEQIVSHETTNNIQVVLDKFQELLDIHQNDSTNIQTIRFHMATFYAEVKNSIEMYYNIHVDVPDDSLTELKEVTVAMYYQLVLRYTSNLYNYLDSYITENRNSLSESLDALNLSSKDVTTSVVRKTMKVRSDATVVANLMTVINNVISIEPTTESFLQLIINNTGSSEAQLLLDYELGGRISGNIGAFVMDNVRWNEPDVLDSVKSELFHQYCSTKKIKR